MIFFNYWITEKKKHFQNQRNTYVLFKEIIRKYFTKESAEVAVHAFIASKLDYCNALLYGLPKYQLQRLQYVQNTAARVVLQVSKFQHITPVLCELHWLPIQYRIIFKILLLVYKSLNGTSPSYLAQKLHYRSHTRSLRSVSNELLMQPRLYTKTYGDREFAVLAPREWNLRWLDWIFLGGYLPSLSINYVGMSKDMEKMLAQLYYIMMTISYDLGFIAIGVAMAT